MTGGRGIDWSLIGGRTLIGDLGCHEPYENICSISCAIHVTWTNQHQTRLGNKGPDFMALDDTGQDTLNRPILGKKKPAKSLT